MFRQLLAGRRAATHFPERGQRHVQPRWDQSPQVRSSAVTLFLAAVCETTVPHKIRAAATATFTMVAIPASLH